MDIQGLPPTARHGALRQAAVELETAFLEQMLKAAGVDESRSAFGGGAGEQHFSSFLRHEHATALASSGGIGLAESIFQALKERQNVE